jgi:hypothetical protein
MIRPLMDDTVPATWLAIGLFAGMLLFLELGRRVGARRLALGHSSSGHAVVDSAIFALFGLLVAFTFSGAATRWDVRRMNIAEEANAIGTAYLRVDLLAAEHQPAVRQHFRDYLDARIGVYAALPDREKALAHLHRAAELQGVIWKAAVPASTSAGAHTDAGKLLVPALNQMFDIMTTRTMAARTHPSPVIFVLLFLLGFGCAMLAGHAMAGLKTWSWLHAAAFAFFIAAGTYVILDIEYPRAGFFRLTEFDQVLVDLRKSMN